MKHILSFLASLTLIGMSACAALPPPANPIPYNPTTGEVSVSLTIPASKTITLSSTGSIVGASGGLTNIARDSVSSNLVIANNLSGRSTSLSIGTTNTSHILLGENAEVPTIGFFGAAPADQPNNVDPATALGTLGLAINIAPTTVAHGGTGLATFTAPKRLLYTTSSTSLASLVTANSGVLVTDSSGNPSISTTLPAVSGASLTSLNASNISSGTLANSRLDPNLSVSTGTFTGDVTAPNFRGTADSSNGVADEGLSGYFGRMGEPNQGYVAAPNSHVLFVKVDGGGQGGIRETTDAFPTISAALDAAFPGDTVMVYPGTYVEKVVLRDSVNIHCIGAVVITDETDDDGATVSDSGGAVTCQFTGNASIYKGVPGNTTPGSAAVRLNGLTSDIYFEAAKATNPLTGCSAVEIGGAGADSAMKIRLKLLEAENNTGTTLNLNGSSPNISVRIGTLRGLQPLLWSGGATFLATVTIEDKIDGSMTDGYGIYSGSSDPGAFLSVSVPYIVSHTCPVWHTSGKLYVFGNAKILRTKTTGTAVTDSTIGWQDGGQLWVESQKVSGGKIDCRVSGGGWFKIQHLDGGYVKQTGDATQGDGKNIFDISDSIGTGGLTIAGGKAIYRGRIDAGSGVPVTVSGGTLTLDLASLITSGTYSIDASSAQNVIIYPGCIANKTTHNITAKVGSLTVSTDAQ